MAFQELAARTGTVVADGDEELTLLTLGRGRRPARAPARRPGPQPGRLQGRAAPARGGRRPRPPRPPGRPWSARCSACPAVAPCRWPRAADRPASYLATVIAPPCVPTGRSRSADAAVADADADGAAQPGCAVISFVGAGPGAADLLTLRAVDRLPAADVVVWAVVAGVAGGAGALPAGGRGPRLRGDDARRASPPCTPPTPRRPSSGSTPATRRSTAPSASRSPGASTTGGPSRSSPACRRWRPPPRPPGAS